LGKAVWLRAGRIGLGGGQVGLKEAQKSARRRQGDAGRTGILSDEELEILQVVARAPE
jgi:hypothetical protein